MSVRQWLCKLLGLNANTDNSNGDTQTRVVGVMVFSATGFSVASAETQVMLLARQYKISRLEAVNLDDGRVVLTVYGRSPQPGEQIKHFLFKVFHLTAEHLRSSSTNPTMDDRDKFFARHLVRPTHITSARLAKGEILTFCLYQDQD